MACNRRHIYSARFSAGGRYYDFEVNVASTGSKYLLISETMYHEEPDDWKRIIVFQENIAQFLAGLHEAVYAMAQDCTYKPDDGKK